MASKDLVNELSLNSSIETRRSAVLLLGNLCANASYHEKLCKATIPIIISFAFPTGLDTDKIAHFQAVAGLRGLASNSTFRTRIIQDGGLEPLFLTLSKTINGADPKTIREATICIFNLTFASLAEHVIATSGMIEVLSSVITSRDDSSRLYAIASLGNLAEYGTDIQDRIINNDCWTLAMSCISIRMPDYGILHETARVLSLLSSNFKSHIHFISTQSSFFQLLNRQYVKDDMFVRRCGIFIMGNLAIDPNNHRLLIDCNLFAKISSTTMVDDILYKRCISYTLKQFSGNIANHLLCDSAGNMQLLILLLRTPCKEIQLEACQSLRSLLTTEICRTHFIYLQGHVDIFRSFETNEPELTREALASLWNLSISYLSKIEIFASSGWSVLLKTCRSEDELLAHAACYIVANVSEASEIQEQMVTNGIVHNLTFAMRSSSTLIIRESIRAIANLSSNMQCTLSLVKFALYTPLVKALSSSDNVCVRFATLALANLSVTEDSSLSLFDEGSLPMLFQLLRERDREWTLCQQWAFITLTNISSCFQCHDALLLNGIIDLIKEKLSETHSNIKASAIRCLSNLSANPRTHERLHESQCLDILMPLCSSGNIYEQPLVASVLRGLSQSEALRECILSEGFLQSLFTVCNTSHNGIHDEILSTFCNISATKCFACELYYVLGFQGLLALLNKDERMPRLFSVLLLGNLISLVDLQESMIKSAITTVIRLTRETDDETFLRCIGLALCNMVSLEALQADIIQKGGIEPIVSLLFTHRADIFRALKALRYLATFPQHREDLVRCSVIEALLSLIAADRKRKNFEEVMAIFYYLSLDDFCKESIAKSELLRLFSTISLSSPTVFFTPIAIRLVANCCELPCCHHFVITYVRSLLTMSSNLDEYSTLREIARLFSNITSSSLILVTIDHERMSHYVLRLCESDDNIASKYGHLSVLNAYIVSKNYWPDDRRINFVNHYIRMNMPGSYEWPHQDFYKRYTLQLLLHCTTTDYARFMLNAAITDLSSDDLEIGFSASYALDKFWSIKEMLQESSLILALHSFISKAGPRGSCHAIAILRKLCCDEQLSKDLLCNRVMDSLIVALNQTLHQTTFDALSREIIGFLYNITSHGYITYGFLEGITLKYAIPFCFSSDDECCRWALGLLANVTEDLDYHLSLNDSDITSMALHHIVHGNVLVKREACRLVCNLLTSSCYQVRFTELDFAHGLTTITALGDDLCSYYIALSLNKLASVYSNGKYLLREEEFSCLLSLMKSSSLKVATFACSALKLLSVNDEFIGIFIKGNTFHISLVLLNSNSIDVRCYIAETFYHVSLSLLLQRWLYEEGLVDALVKVCCSTQRDVSMVKTCIGVFENLAFHEENRRLMLKHNQLIMLLYELASDERLEIQEQAAKLFSLLTSQIHHLRKVHESLLLDSLTKQLSDPNTDTAKYAAMTIGNVAGYCQQELVRSEIVEGLIRLLSVAWSSIYACKALSVLLNQNIHSIQCAIENDRLISQLVRLCASEDKNEETQALITICNLSQYERSHSKLMKYGLMRVFKTFKPFSSTTVQRTKAKILSNVCRSNGCLPHIYRQRIVGTAIKLLQAFPEELVVYIIWSLCSICSKSDFASRSFAESGQASSILPHIQAEKWPMTQRAFTSLLCNMSTLDFIHTSKLRIFETVDLIGQCDDKVLQRLALVILINLSADRRKQAADVAMRGGRIQWVISKLKDNCLSVKTIASLCFCNISIRKRMQSAVIALGPYHLLAVHLIKNEHTFLQIAAALCMVNICTNQSMRALFNKDGTNENLCSYAESHSVHDILNCFIFANISLGISQHLSTDDGTLSDEGIISFLNTSIRLTGSLNLYVASTATAVVTKWALSGYSSVVLLGKWDLFKVPEVSSIDMERDLAIFFLFLSRSARYKMSHDVRIILYRLYAAISSADKVVTHTASVVIANITERVDFHDTLLTCGAINQINRFIRYDCSATRCEGLRSLINILNSSDCNFVKVLPLLDALIFPKHKEDEVEEYFTALLFRRISTDDNSHQWLMKEGLPTLLNLLRSNSTRTIRHGARAFRNLCSKEHNVMTLNQTDGVDEILISLLKYETMEIKCIGLSVLSDLVAVSNAAIKVSDYGISLVPLLSRINQSEEDLNTQIVNLLVSISEYRSNQNNGFLIRSVDALIRLAQSKRREISQVCSS